MLLIVHILCMSYFTSHVISTYLEQFCMDVDFNDSNNLFHIVVFGSFHVTFIVANIFPIYWSMLNDFCCFSFHYTLTVIQMICISGVSHANKFKRIELILSTFDFFPFIPASEFILHIFIQA